MFNRIYSSQLANSAYFIQFKSTRLNRENIGARELTSIMNFLELYYDLPQDPIIGVTYTELTETAEDKYEVLIRVYVISKDCTKFWIPIRKSYINPIKQHLKEFNPAFYISSNLAEDEVLLGINPTAIRIPKFGVLMDHVVAIGSSYIEVSDAILLTDEMIRIIMEE